MSGGLLTLFVFYSFTRRQEKRGTFKTAVIGKGIIRREIAASGTLEPLAAVEVGTQVSGIISKVWVNYNDKVKRGQVIAELDKTALLATLKDMESNLYKAEVQLEQSRKEYDRNKVLLEKKAIPQVDHDQSYYAYLNASANYQSAVSQVAKARTNLGYATVVAPIDGVILSRNIDVGQTVAASFNTPRLFTIAEDLTKMEIRASIDEADIGQVQVGQFVQFTVDAFPEDSFEGRVREIRLEPVVSSNVVTYTVIIGVNNVKQLLMPGMTALVKIVVEENKDVLKVPVASVKFSLPPELLHKGEIKLGLPVPPVVADEESYLPLKPGTERLLWLKRGDRLEPKKITLGISDGTEVEVKGEGLRTGDSVVVQYVNEPVNVPSAPSNPFAPKFPKRK